jgi:hypothetical protein
MKKAGGATELRILSQRWVRDSLHLHLACEDGRLLLEVEPCRAEGEPPWKVGASIKRGNDASVSASETGASRREALRNLAAAWQREERVHDLRMFDWTAVETLLAGVEVL